MVKGKWTHERITIAVDNYGNFEAEIGDVFVSEKSLGEAKNAVSKVVKHNQKKWKKEILELRVVGIAVKKRTGQFGVKPEKPYVSSAVLTGVNRTSRDLVITGLPPGWELTNVMADTPKNKAALAKFLVLEEVKKEIDNFLVGKISGWGRIEIDRYGEILNEVRRAYAVSRDRKPMKEPRR